MELMTLFCEVLIGLLILEALAYGVALLVLTRIIAKQRKEQEIGVQHESN